MPKEFLIFNLQNPKGCGRLVSLQKLELDFMGNQSHETEASTPLGIDFLNFSSRRNFVSKACGSDVHCESKAKKIKQL
jgi:hypothetical protein